MYIVSKIVSKMLYIDVSPKVLLEFLLDQTVLKKILNRVI